MLTALAPYGESVIGQSEDRPALSGGLPLSTQAEYAPRNMVASQSRAFARASGKLEAATAGSEGRLQVPPPRVPRQRDRSLGRALAAPSAQVCHPGSLGAPGRGTWRGAHFADWAGVMCAHGYLHTRRNHDLLNNAPPPAGPRTGAGLAHRPARRGGGGRAQCPRAPLAEDAPASTRPRVPLRARRDLCSGRRDGCGILED